MKEAVKLVAAGLSVTMLARHAWLPPESARQLSRVFDTVANSSDLVIVDSDINLDDAFPLATLDDSELVIQVSADPDMIKAAYGLIKRVSNRIGRRGYGILVSGASEKEARLIYTNMAQAIRLVGNDIKLMWKMIIA